MKIEEDFIDYLSGATFYVGNDRYGRFGHGHVVVSNYGDDEHLEEITQGLDLSDYPALEYGRELSELHAEKEIFLGYSNDPVEAMRVCVQEMRDYYFGELNKEEADESQRQWHRAKFGEQDNG